MPARDKYTENRGNLINVKIEQLGSTNFG